MSHNPGPPPYPEAPCPNIQGPQQHPSGPPYGGGAPIIIMQQQQQLQQQQVIVRPSGTNHALCCLICIFTSGLNLPCWIWSCITK